MQADFSHEGNETEELQPLQRAKDRLSNHIFNNYSVLPTEAEATTIVLDLLPYLACHLALFHATEAVEEIVKRSSTS